MEVLAKETVVERMIIFIMKDKASKWRMGNIEEEKLTYADAVSIFQDTDLNTIIQLIEDCELTMTDFLRYAQIIFDEYKKEKAGEKNE